MKKLILAVALLIAIVIPSLAFFDKNMDETKIVSSTPTEITKIPSDKDKIENPQFTIEHINVNSAPINDTDDGWENSDELEMEMDFRVCG